MIIKLCFGCALLGNMKQCVCPQRNSLKESAGLGLGPITEEAGAQMDFCVLACTCSEVGFFCVKPTAAEIGSAALKMVWVVTQVAPVYALR